MSVNADEVVEASRVRALHDLNVLDTPREERFDRIVRLARTMFEVPMAAVNLVDAHRQWTKAEAGLPGLENTAADDSMCRYTVQQTDALVVPDTTTDPRFRTNRFVTDGTGIRFYAGQPLHAPGGEAVGSLCLFDTRPRTLTAREQEMLAEMGRWVETELAHQAELDRAAEVQQVLMPHTTPALAGYQLAGRCLPTHSIGGDFYTWHTLPDGNLQIHVADVMGKGIPAALIAATVRAMLIGAAQYNDQHEALHRAAAASWEMLNDTRAFVTAFSARLHPATGRVEYVDAGHGLAFVLSAGGYRRLEHSGPPLGIFPDSTWQTRTTILAPGETLVVASDGFLDFFPTLEETLAHARRAQLHRLSAERLVERATAFARAQGHPDDVTVLALRRTNHGSTG